MFFFSYISMSLDLDSMSWALETHETCTLTFKKAHGQTAITIYLVLNLCSILIYSNFYLIHANSRQFTPIHPNSPQFLLIQATSRVNSLPFLYNSFDSSEFMGQFTRIHSNSLKFTLIHSNSS